MPFESRREVGGAGPGSAFFTEHWRSLISNLPASISRHLAAERTVLAAVLSESTYDTVVEAGCADGSLLLPVVVPRLRYFGIDLTADAVAEASSRVGGQSAVVRGDVMDLPRLLPRWRPEPRLLTAFPFNLFGILPDPLAALKVVFGVGSDVLILGYRPIRAAERARASYFRSCGLHGEVWHDDRGLHFQCDGYQSSVYRPFLIAAWLRAAGYRVVTTWKYGEIGLAAHGTHRTRGLSCVSDRTALRR